MSSNSQIIKMLAEKMDKSQKAVYLLVKRKFFKSPADEDNDVADSVASKKTSVVEEENSLSKTDQSGSERDMSAVDVQSFSGTYELENGEIFEIEPTKVKHRNKEIIKAFVTPGWASKLTMFLYMKTNLSCKFDFINVWVTRDEEIKTTGHCGQCKAQASIMCQRNVINIKINNISSAFEHKRRYQIRGELKDRLTKELEHKSALAVQTKAVNDIITDNDNLSSNFIPILPNINALRVLKYRGTLFNLKEGRYQ